MQTLAHDSGAQQVETTESREPGNIETHTADPIDTLLEDIMREAKVTTQRKRHAMMPANENPNVPARATAAPPPPTPDIRAIAKAAHDFVALAADVGISANIPKVHTDQPHAACDTNFDIDPHMHLFPSNPKPTPLLPQIMPATREGFKVAGCWQGPPQACNNWIMELISRLKSSLGRLLDKRLRNVSLQIKWCVFRMCYRAQAKLTFAMRSMVPSDISKGMEAAASQQHETVLALLPIPPNLLPTSQDQKTLHPSAARFRLHLPTNYAGCAIANPVLTYHAAHLGAAASTQPLISHNRFLADLADPSTWKGSQIPHLEQAVDSWERFTTLPAFHETPAQYPEAYRAFMTSITDPDGAPSIALLGNAADHHPQGNLSKILSKQIFNDLVGDPELPDLTRAELHAGATTNARRCLVPLYLHRDSKLDNAEFSTTILLAIGAPLPYISTSTRCSARCPTHGPEADITIPGVLGAYHISETWHRRGHHQNSCKYAKNLKHRHDTINNLVGEIAALAGAAIDLSETFISAEDNKRIDLTIWHSGICTRGIGIDTTVINEFTMARLHQAATMRGSVISSAERLKENKYTTLCDAVNLDFCVAAFNMDGGLGARIDKLLQRLWDAKRAEAKLRKLPTRSIDSQQRRSMEKLSTTIARLRHRTINQNLTGRTGPSFILPEEVTDMMDMLPLDLDWLE